MTRAVPLCFLKKKALTVWLIGSYPAIITVGLRLSYSHKVFRSRLREDFQPFLLTRLTLVPGSLLALLGVLVPIIAYWFQVGLNYNSMRLLPQG